MRHDDVNFSRSALRIFVLEDHVDTRTCIKLHLEKLGHNVMTAGSLSEATKEMRNSDFDVLLSDIGLSDGLGWGFMESLHFAKPIFAIAMSGLGTEEDRARSKSAGFRFHLTKPLDFGYLDEILNEAFISVKSRVGGSTVIE